MYGQDAFWEQLSSRKGRPHPSERNVFALPETVNVSFDYEYEGFAAIEPRDPNTDRAEYQRMLKLDSRLRFYRPKYPKYPEGIVVDTDIQDLRPHGIRLKGKYSGNIAIDLKDVSHGGRITMGSLSGREDIVAQHLFRFRKGRRYDNVWMGMPIALFHVEMELTLPTDHYEAIKDTDEMLEKVEREEIAKLQLENQIRPIKKALKIGLSQDRINEYLERLEPGERLQAERTFDFIRSRTNKERISEILDELEDILDEESDTHQEYIEYITENLTDIQVRKKWARQLGDLHQELQQDTERKTKGKEERRIRRKAKRDLKIIEKSDNYLEDIFEIFRFYFNTYILSVKYLLGQYWMDPLQKWEIDYFYSNNEVKMDDMVLVRRPIYTTGPMIQEPPSTNLTKTHWDNVTDLNFGQMMNLSTGFTADGIFTKAYEVLTNDEPEVCLVLLDIGLEFALTSLTRELTPEGDEIRRKLGLPDTTNEDFSTSDLLEDCQKPMEKIADELGSSRSKVRRIWQHLEFVHEFRNAIIHKKTIFREHIYRILEARRTGERGDFINPFEYSINLEVDPESIRHARPFWWRVVQEVWFSSYEAFRLLRLFKHKLLKPTKTGLPSEYPEFSRDSYGIRGKIRYGIISLLEKMGLL